MIVRCGRCGIQFEAPGEGRFACPSCGTPNDVVLRSQPDPGIVAPPEPVVEDEPSPRVVCPECEFSFIVGPVERVPCPMCGTTVEISGGNGP
jgi:Zn finger protein HypA/HybF involved in hydrogenase expression